ncbi:MAG: hypothetical protein R2713_23835 [Ilumatobacteraceae bacterium]
MAEHRLQVLAVAHALETHLTITGDDVMAIIQATEGPFIDGRGATTPTRPGRSSRRITRRCSTTAAGGRGIPALPEIDGVTGESSARSWPAASNAHPSPSTPQHPQATLRTPDQGAPSAVHRAVTPSCEDGSA